MFRSPKVLSEHRHVVLLHLPAHPVKWTVLVPYHVVDDEVSHGEAVFCELFHHALRQFDAEGFRYRYQYVPRLRGIPYEVDDLP